LSVDPTQHWRSQNLSTGDDIPAATTRQRRVELVMNLPKGCMFWRADRCPVRPRTRIPRWRRICGLCFREQTHRIRGLYRNSLMTSRRLRRGRHIGPLTDQHWREWSRRPSSGRDPFSARQLARFYLPGLRWRSSGPLSSSGRSGARLPSTPTYFLRESAPLEQLGRDLTCRGDRQRGPRPVVGGAQQTGGGAVDPQQGCCSTLRSCLSPGRHHDHRHRISSATVDPGRASLGRQDKRRCAANCPQLAACYLERNPMAGVTAAARSRKRANNVPDAPRLTNHLRGGASARRISCGE
jgi:hypothetical protein